jgi:hypothetical protein
LLGLRIEVKPFAQQHNDAWKLTALEDNLRDVEDTESLTLFLTYSYESTRTG